MPIVATLLAALIHPNAARAAGDAHVSVAQHVRTCVARLGPHNPEFTPPEIALLITTRLAEGPYPAELRRQYLKGDRPRVTLSYDVSADDNALKVLVRADEIDETKLTDFFAILRSDLKLRSGRSGYGLQPYTANPDDVQRTPTTPRIWRASTNQRNPLQSDEAATLFSLLDLILRERLEFDRVADAVDFAALPNAGVKF